MATMYKIILPDTSTLDVPDPKKVVILASQKANELNKILVIVEEDEYGIKKEFATVYPGGQVRRPVDISELAKNLKFRK